ncbi:MAG: NAD(P)-dependent oxidoreductase [Bacilli bacterium]
MAKAFGMDVWAYSPSKEGAGCDGVAQFKSVDEIFSNCHIISLNCPLNLSNRQDCKRQKHIALHGWSLVHKYGQGALVDERAMAEL